MIEGHRFFKLAESNGERANIPFNLPARTGGEITYLKQLVNEGSLSGDGEFNKRCARWFEKQLGCARAFLTPSGTAALEMAALLADIQAGDEVIMPSYTFSSTANAFILRGAKIVFVDIRPDTMNLDEGLIEATITSRTKALVPVHYGGVACEMETILELAGKYRLWVIEDAAQGLMANYKGKPLGALGHLGCLSFHETKNYTCGEGGALIINDPDFVERAEILREKGTDRSRFFRGEVDKYTWVDVGSSFLLGEFGAAFLLAQLEQAEAINRKRLRLWTLYDEGLKPLEEKGHLELARIPDNSQHNAHLFFMKTKDEKERDRLIGFLKERGVSAVFHYVPLHSSPAGKRFGRFHGEDRYTTRESQRILRLPLYYALKEEEVNYVIQQIQAFYR